MHHAMINVSDFDASRRFYTSALAPLGLEPTVYEGACGFGDFWITERDAPAQGVHFAFVASDRERVDAFHASALKAGGVDNGAPGLRVDYGENYYAAFVLDPDGVNVEAVCDVPEGAGEDVS
jgi:catechol 2,3-dioxygenase-like lactoylglutathione lyase family enzyme